MPEKPEKTTLVGAWLHLHEKDAGETMMFVPAESGLPPSRGRSGFRLNADGSADLLRPGATDKPEQHDAQWRLEGQELFIEPVGGATASGAQYHVLESVPGKLVVTRR